MQRLFIETGIFQELLDELKKEFLENEIKSEILKSRCSDPVISGTGGVRKIRVADTSNNRGKSGSYRVLYFDLPKVEVTYLIFIYEKSEMENISKETKATIKQLTKALKDEYEKKSK